MLLSAFKGSAQNEGVTRSQYRSTGVDHIRATGPDSASGVLYRDFTQNACKPGTSSVFPCCGLVPFRNTDSPFVSTIPNHFRGCDMGSPVLLSRSKLPMAPLACAVDLAIAG